jgi:hypothetical protein
MGEPQTNALRLVVAEGKVSEQLSSVNVGGTHLESHSVEIDSTSRSFEFIWKRYVAFLVLNESFGAPSTADEIFEGQNVRLYSQSRFLQYVKSASIASGEYPGRLLHFEIICQFHVVEVVSTEPPHFRQISPTLTIQ